MQNMLCSGIYQSTAPLSGAGTMETWNYEMVGDINA